MRFDVLCSPLQFLQDVGICADQDWLREYAVWFEREGQGISDAVDRAGTPWLRMFDRWGAPVDEILYPPEYWRMLKHGYRAGVLWRVFEQNSLIPAYLASKRNRGRRVCTGQPPRVSVTFTCGELAAS